MSKIFLSFILLLLFHCSVFGQVTIVEGVVQNDIGEPIPFVTVAISNSTEGTITDSLGKFFLKYNGKQNQSIEFSFLGYLRESRDVHAGKSNYYEVVMKKDAQIMNTVVIKPKRRYRNKNNPAVDLIRKIVNQKDSNDATNHYSKYQYEQYEKIVMSASNLPRFVKKSFILKPFAFVYNNVDTQRYEGKAILPLYIEENVAQRFFKNNPLQTTKIISAQKRTPLHDRLIDNDGLTLFLQHMHKEIDIYKTNIMIAANTFLSPISAAAPSFYKYYIEDTFQLGSEKLVNIKFEPRNSSDLLFEGDMQVRLDGTYSVKNIELGINKNTNLNWINDLEIVLDYEQDDSGKSYLSHSHTVIHFGLFQGKQGMVGERILFTNHFDGNSNFDNSIFNGLELQLDTSDTNKNEIYWKEKRSEALSLTEEKSYINMDSLSKKKAFKRLVSWGNTLFTGYKDILFAELGPIYGFYSFNDIEGHRWRVGGRTSSVLSNRFFGESYLAYGTKDKQWKGFLSAAYSLKKKKIFAYPYNYVKVAYQRDITVPGQFSEFELEDNVLLAIKRGINDKFLYNDIVKLEHVIEFGDHIGFKAMYKYWRQSPVGKWHLLDQNNGIRDTVSSLTTSDFGLEIRYAPKEQVMDRYFRRSTIKNAYPIITFNANFGIKDFLGGDYNYQALRIRVFKRFYLSQLGFADVDAGSGYIFGQLPFPLLDVARGNQTYAFRLQEYNMMNFMEFVSDHYLHLNIDYHMRGFLFNKIPLLRYLKLREVAGFKILYGGLRNENNPALNPSVVAFPINNEGQQTTFGLQDKPYIEYSIGVENIFNLFRIDLVKRANYLHLPNTSSWGVRFSMAFWF